ncbi:tetratricopeptide repeat protein [Aurantiacibacter xanthus]|nr:tetratricopeptide repeat protein [Aurantiacibacter xanthus]
MIVLQAAVALMMAQAAPAAMMAGMNTDQHRDAAYEELTQGETDAAIARLEANLAQNPEDPALLINLGSAWAVRGDKDKAAGYYRAAARSDVRYQLELADGEWIDSRAAARLALRTLEQSAVAMN